jgi:hypothetical protein
MSVHARQSAGWPCCIAAGARAPARPRVHPALHASCAPQSLCLQVQTAACCAGSPDLGCTLCTSSRVTKCGHSTTHARLAGAQLHARQWQHLTLSQRRQRLRLGRLSVVTASARVRGGGGVCFTQRAAARRAAQAATARQELAAWRLLDRRAPAAAAASPHLTFHGMTAVNPGRSTTLPLAVNVSPPLCACVRVCVCVCVYVAHSLCVARVQVFR